MCIRKIDSFWINLNLRHPSFDPQKITEELGIQPWRSVASGREVGSTVSKSTKWSAHYREGLDNEEFARALEDLVTLFSVAHGFLLGFYEDGGEAILEINQQVATDNGVVFDLGLQPFFLQSLGEHGVFLKVKAWITLEGEGLAAEDISVD
jgi:hypothetical protein